MQHVLFIGLGRMGYPMAGHITKLNDYSVSVYNRSDKKIHSWLDAHHGKIFEKTVRYSHIILCVGNDQDVENLLIGEANLLNCLDKNGVVIDHTTTSANLAKRMHEKAKEQGKHFLDAPVSGGESGAISGQLSCMVGGNNDIYEAAKELLTSYCKKTTYIGPSGSGQIAKMANQFCIAGILTGLSEAICLLQNEDLNTQAVLEAIGGGAAQSWQMDNRFSTMAKGEFDFGFAIDHMIKDLKYALTLSKEQGWNAKVSQQVLNWYQKLSEEGHGLEDTSVLIEHYRKQINRR